MIDIRQIRLRETLELTIRIFTSLGHAHGAPNYYYYCFFLLTETPPTAVVSQMGAQGAPKAGLSWRARETPPKAAASRVYIQGVPKGTDTLQPFIIKKLDNLRICFSYH